MMIEIKIQLKNPKADLLAVKGALAYYCEQFHGWASRNIGKREW